MMRDIWHRLHVKFGFLAVTGLLLVLPRLCAQTAITITVEDSGGAVLSGARLQDAAGHLLGVTGADGRATIACATPCRLHVAAPGFSETTAQVADGAVLRLEPASTAEQISVTAYRLPMGSLESPVATRLLTAHALESTAEVTLDGKMRQLPGVELFRRSSSLVANPTSQGISLRGLGSTSASRTLVTLDDVPLNDAVGGWIHWQEQPELAIESVELVRGGVSDLYGSSAIGGVVNMIPARPAGDMAELRSGFGGEGTFDESLLAETKRGAWGLLAAGGVLDTDGYIQIAPGQRGPVDIASNVHSQNGVILAEHKRDPLRLFVRGSGFNEARSNGTPDQTNGTRLWRYATGGDWQGRHGDSAALRLYGSTEHYRQTFSAISNLPIFGDPGCSYRCGETVTRFSSPPDNELGAVAHWIRPLGAGLVVLAGADVHDVRVWDREQKYGSSAQLTLISDHQRDSAAYGEMMWSRNAWTVIAAGRMDWYQNYDGHEVVWNGSTWIPDAQQPPQTSQHIFDPRLGISRKLSNHWAVSASGFRAFRAPTPSELYRSTQVGSQLTLSNPSLLSERATGWESGLATEWSWGTIRTSYFQTQVNRPITAVTINPTSSPILLDRENLGQIESRGLGIDFELAPQRWLALDGGYQFAHATVTQGTQYVGNWIPAVARNMATLNLRASQRRLGVFSLQGRLSGRQFDDAANSHLLHGYFRLDAYGSHDFRKGLQLFAAGENLFNRQIEVGKTPTTTLAMPRVARIGFQVRLGKAGR
ncbi:MAG: TonB-dependent receptor [Acidobacteriota bacterium]|nr:TonB-dependent receptor [Acidobacteriota bacterium]